VFFDRDAVVDEDAGGRQDVLRGAVHRQRLR